MPAMEKHYRVVTVFCAHALPRFKARSKTLTTKSTEDTEKVKNKKRNAVRL